MPGSIRGSAIVPYPNTSAGPRRPDQRWRARATAIPASLAPRHDRRSSASGGSQASTCRPGRGAGGPERRAGGVASAASSASRRRPVDRPHPAQVPVELAALDEVGERQLVERRRAHVGRLLRLGDRLDEPRRHDQPAEPQPGRERLARRARRRRPGPARAPGARRSAPGRSGTPRRSRPRRSSASRARAQAMSAAPALGGSTPPVGNWWAAVTTTASGVAPREQVDAQAVLVDGDRRPGSRPAAVDRSRGTPGRTGPRRRPSARRAPRSASRDQPEALGEPVADDDVAPGSAAVPRTRLR